MGVTSQLLSTFARKPIYGYRAMVYAVFAIGLLGILCLGPPHVHERAQPNVGFGFLDADADDRCALSRQDL
jgi:hypothetical protein